MFIHRLKPHFHTDRIRLTVIRKYFLFSPYIKDQKNLVIDSSLCSIQIELILYQQSLTVAVDLSLRLSSV